MQNACTSIWLYKIAKKKFNPRITFTFQNALFLIELYFPISSPGQVESLAPSAFVEIDRPTPAANKCTGYTDQRSLEANHTKAVGFTS
ncbi:Serine protease [Dirofilaria immitis]